MTQYNAPEFDYFGRSNDEFLVTWTYNKWGGDTPTCPYLYLELRPNGLWYAGASEFGFNTAREAVLDAGLDPNLFQLPYGWAWGITMPGSGKIVSTHATEEEAWENHVEGAYRPHPVPVYS